ncbi:MAG: radical SAM/SPASM domain-containing protein [Synechococcales cyanobacterium]
MLERLHLEITNVCNFKCEFCPDAIMERRRGHMALSLLTRILDELATTPLTDILAYHLMGEPLIHPHIMTAIDLALERNLRLHLTTNGSTFALKPEQIPQLIHRPLPKLTISLQTPDPTTFALRGAPPRLSAESYFAGIRQLIHDHQRSDSPTVIHLKFLDTTPHPFLVPHKALSIADSREAMQHHLRQWIDDLCPGIPTLTELLDRYQPGHWQLLPLNDRLVLETFPLDSWGHAETAQVYPSHWGYCNGASQQAGILYDGTVVPCCKDYEGRIPLGSVRERSLQAILQDAPACQLRQGFDRWQVRDPHCQRCLGADTRLKAVLRPAASIAYFKVYRPWQQQRDPQWGQI